MIRYNIDINSIKIPNGFKKKIPKLYKRMGMEAYYKKYHHFYGNIIVNKKFKILDGYVIYYVAKHVLKLTVVPVVVLSIPERIVRFFKGRGH